MYREYLPMVKRFVLANSGTNEESRDLFHDVLLILAKNASHLRLTAKLSTYVMGVAYKLWMYRLRKQKGVFLVSDMPEEAAALAIPESDLQLYSRAITPDEQLQQILNQLDAVCQKVLEFYHIHRLSMPEIAERLGYKNPRVAIVKKNKCLNQAKEAAVKLKISVSM